MAAAGGCLSEHYSPMAVCWSVNVCQLAASRQSATIVQTLSSLQTSTIINRLVIITSDSLHVHSQQQYLSSIYRYTTRPAPRRAVSSSRAGSRQVVSCMSVRSSARPSVRLYVRVCVCYLHRAGPQPSRWLGTDVDSAAAARAGEQFGGAATPGGSTINRFVLQSEHTVGWPARTYTAARDCWPLSTDRPTDTVA